MFRLGILLPPTNAHVDGHNGSHMNELVELQLFVMLGRPIPDGHDVQGLDDLDALLAIADDAIGQDLHDLLGQRLLDGRVTSATGHAQNGQEER